MNVDLVLSNLLNPPVLFFFLGMLAIWLHSDLDVPQPLPKFFALYLLLSIGFRGGVDIPYETAAKSIRIETPKKPFSPCAPRRVALMKSLTK